MPQHLKNTCLQGGRYRLDSLVGSGGFGNTYLGYQVDLDRKVAIKEFFMKEFCERDESTSQVIIPTEGSRLIVDRYKQKFLKEAQMIASLKNEHIIKIYDIFEENNTAYYVMEYVDGGSLKDTVELGGVLAEQLAVKYICQIAEALSYLHANNILHLDIKPANILIDNDDTAILIDFGISKHYDADGGQTSSTPAGISKGYAPIEQYQQGSMANFSPATDIYSLGATMFFLLTGKTPPEATVIYEYGLPNINASERITHVIQAAMQPKRQRRLQTAIEFISAIHRGNLNNGKDDHNSIEYTEIIDNVVDNHKNSNKTNQQSSKRKSLTKTIVVITLLVTIFCGLNLYLILPDRIIESNFKIIRVDYQGPFEVDKQKLKSLFVGKTFKIKNGVNDIVNDKLCLSDLEIKSEYSGFFSSESVITKNQNGYFDTSIHIDYIGGFDAERTKFGYLTIYRNGDSYIRLVFVYSMKPSSPNLSKSELTSSIQYTNDTKLCSQMINDCKVFYRIDKNAIHYKPFEKSVILEGVIPTNGKNITDIGMNIYGDIGISYGTQDRKAYKLIISDSDIE